MNAASSVLTHQLWLTVRSRRLVWRVVRRLLTYAIILAGAALLLLPFLWMLSTSLKPDRQVFVYPPEWIPDPVMWSNYLKAWTALPFTRYLQNTMLITGLAMLGDVSVSAIVGYAFSKLRWPGRDLLFLVLLGTMMLPAQVTMVPVFLLFKNLGWVNTFYPLIVPSFFANALFVFLLRQFFMTIPHDLHDAARIDGANDWQVFTRIILPLARPALATVAVFSFQRHWTDFLGPLIYVSSNDDLRTMALGLYAFKGIFNIQWTSLMAISVLMLLPTLVIFFLFQRYFVEGVTLTGIKG